MPRSKPAWSPISRTKREGVVRGGEASGKTVFVAGALPGERVSFRRRGFHKSHDEAELIEVLEASPHRVTPRCAHFGVCGGCAMQHLDPDGADSRPNKKSWRRISSASATSRPPNGCRPC